MTTPLLLVGDGPWEPSGLGRILRDLGTLAVQYLDVELASAGGPSPGIWKGWTHVPIDPRNDDWGAAQVHAIYRELFGSRPGVLWHIWDPSRLVPYRGLDLPVQRWAYTAIDAENVRQTLGGPAAAAVADLDRVIAYGRYGARILRPLRHGSPVSFLPHGLMTSVYAEPANEAETAWVDETLGPYVGKAWLLGCVATNQPRKDLSWYFSVLAALRAEGEPVYGWLHTDVPTKAWSLSQLTEDFELARKVTVTTGTLTDRQLALLYQRSAVTLAPGLGEGFGYPIVESLAAGTPVVHHTYAGGADLVPRSEWRVPVAAWRLEGVYTLKRPVLTAEDGRNAVLRAKRWAETVGEATARAYCRGSVAHLDWAHLAPRWLTWMRRGLEGRA